jgi:hypothetical protein
LVLSSIITELTFDQLNFISFDLLFFASDKMIPLVTAAVVNTIQGRILSSLFPKKDR